MLTKITKEAMMQPWRAIPLLFCLIMRQSHGVPDISQGRKCQENQTRIGRTNLCNAAEFTQSGDPSIPWTSDAPPFPSTNNGFSRTSSTINVAKIERRERERYTHPGMAVDGTHPFDLDASEHSSLESKNDLSAPSADTEKHAGARHDSKEVGIMGVAKTSYVPLIISFGAWLKAIIQLNNSLAVRAENHQSVSKVKFAIEHDWTPTTMYVKGHMSTGATVLMIIYRALLSSKAEAL